MQIGGCFVYLEGDCDSAKEGNDKLICEEVSRENPFQMIKKHMLCFGQKWHGWGRSQIPGKFAWATCFVFFPTKGGTEGFFLGPKVGSCG